MFKKKIVEEDEKENGIRKILNFGHTFGHAIEAYYHMNGFLHGEAIGIGMLLVSKDKPYYQDLKDILTVSGVTGMMISNIMGFGNQMGYTHQYRGVTYSVNLVSKLRVETVVKDEIVQEIVDKVTETLSSGNVGDGKIFIYPVEEAIRIRTGEKGENAL